MATQAVPRPALILPHLRQPQMRFAGGLGLCAALALAATLLANAPGLRVMGALSVALILGLAWRAALGSRQRQRAGVAFSARTLLRWGVILMGVRLNFALVAHAGPRILLLDVIVVGCGVTGIVLLGRRAGLSRGLRTTVAFGSSICGASAVGAVAPLAGASEEETSIAVGICGVLGTIGVVLYTLAAPLLHLTHVQYGVLTGSTLHEVAQVVAASFSQGTASGDLGTVVKLTRVLLLAPTALILAGLTALRARGVGNTGGAGGMRQVPIPWFVFGFIAVAALNSAGIIPHPVAALLLQVSTFLFLMAMAAMGLQVDLRAVRRTGLPALGVAVVGWACLVILSRVLIAVLGIA